MSDVEVKKLVAMDKSPDDCSKEALCYMSVLLLSHKLITPALLI